VRGLKYRGYTALAPFMGSRMAVVAPRLLEKREPVLVPVPLSQARLRERGFNQAEVLARALGRSAGWPVSDVLDRGSSGAPQAGKRRREREAIPPGEFVVRRGARVPSQGEASVLLVDDVVTTGATAAACVEALHAAGAVCLGTVSFTRATGGFASA
jgi:predicted amidophosphoribosyltransferase